MREANTEFGRAVTEVLEYLDATPETVGAALGINGRTLQAMSQGHVPLRSLIIRFAEGLRERCKCREGAKDWWGDADAWLRIAGQDRRSDNTPPERPTRKVDRWHTPPPGPGEYRSNASPPTPPPPPDPAAQEPAKEHYRPVYERRAVGESQVHVFLVRNGADETAFEIILPFGEDYRARAGDLKQDLAAMEKARFERKYSRFRVGSGRGGRE